jgi:hypothetical protein
MKKSFIFVLAALLVVAFTAPVMAQTKVEFSGSYRVRAHYYNNEGLASNSDDETKRSWLDQRFRMAIRFMPSENLTLNVALEANDTVWGARGANIGYGTEAGNFSNAETAGTIEMYNSYMAIKSAVGVFNFGRMQGGTDGLANLGYAGGPMGNGLPFDAEEPRDRFKWVLPTGPLTTIFVFDKRVENDRWTGIRGTRNTNEYDSDRDTYALVLIYKFANGGVSGTLAYDRDHARNAAGNYATSPNAGDAARDSELWVFDGAIALNFGPVGIHAEIQYLSGELTVEGVTPSTDLEGLNFYIDVTYNYGPGTVGLFYVMAQGDNTPGDNKNEAALFSLGGDYTPFVIATDYSADGWGGSGIQLYGAWIDHSLTEDLMFSAAIGFFTVDAPAAGWDDDYGTEIDLRLSYNLMANLTYDVTFGYFMGGDWFKGGVAGVDVGNAWLLQQALTLSF